MRQNDTKLFKKKRKLIEMIDLRLNGWSISALAIKYNCDKSSIRYQCDKYKIDPPNNEIYAVDRIISQTVPKVIGFWKIVNGERVNMGKSYKEYLQDSRTKYPPNNWL